MELKINNRKVRLLKSHKSADYEYKTVLSYSSFKYVELWLRSQKGKKYENALFYWKQAYTFERASEKLPIEAKPLTAYYCIMNATKALLSIHGVSMVNICHGVSASRQNTCGSIRQDEIIYTGSGVLFELSKYLGEPLNKASYKVFDLLYNIPCIHRTFTITYSDMPDLFIPINNAYYEVFKNVPHNRFDSYIRFNICQRYNINQIIRNIHNSIEKVSKERDCFFRLKARWSYPVGAKQHDIAMRINQYHSKIRKYFYYISGTTPLWYVKKYLPRNSHIIDRHSLTLIYGVMHWLSELVRYSPDVFDKVMNSRQNWLIQEFVNMALPQFIDEISSEITGADILCPGLRS